MSPVTSVLKDKNRAPKGTLVFADDSAIRRDEKEFAHSLEVSRALGTGQDPEPKRADRLHGDLKVCAGLSHLCQGTLLEFPISAVSIELPAQPGESDGTNDDHRDERPHAPSEPGSPELKSKHRRFPIRPARDPRVEASYRWGA